jgi:predicted RNA binding protein YcfA (HicA-like mRNA interferase family)
MPRAPRITGRELIDRLKSHGFLVVRVRGSHHVLRHADGRTTVVPVHTGEVIGPGLFSKILADCSLRVEDVRSSR